MEPGIQSANTNLRNKKVFKPDVDKMLCNLHQLSFQLPLREFRFPFGYRESRPIHQLRLFINVKQLALIAMQTIRLTQRY